MLRYQNCETTFKVLSQLSEGADFLEMRAQTIDGYPKLFVVNTGSPLCTHLSFHYLSQSLSNDASAH